MHPVAALTELGGVAGLRPLLRLTSRKRLRQAVARGEIRRIGRNGYRLADADTALVRAREVGGVVSHLSAATLHGWEVAFPATCPWITVRRNAEVSDREGMYLFWADLSGETGPVTSPLRRQVMHDPDYVRDCLVTLAQGPRQGENAA